MDITINRPRDGLHASQELIVRAAQEAKQLDDASVWMLKQLRQLTNVIPMTGGLPVVLAIQSTGQARVRQETVVLAVQALAASAHDRETGDHAQRVMQLAEAIACRLAQSEEEIHLLRLAALLRRDAGTHRENPLLSLSAETTRYSHSGSRIFSVNIRTPRP